MPGAHPSWLFFLSRGRRAWRNERAGERTPGETKIKCKWKFIARGNRRRFRTFKYFINFPSCGLPGGPARPRDREAGTRGPPSAAAPVDSASLFFRPAGPPYIHVDIVMLLKLLNGYGSPGSARRRAPGIFSAHPGAAGVMPPRIGDGRARAWRAADPRARRIERPSCL